MTTLPRNDDGTLASWAWPGGYPIYYLDKGNRPLCPSCAQELDNTGDDEDKPIRNDINWENSSLTCDECNQRIESAYAEEEVEIEEVNKKKG